MENKTKKKEKFPAFQQKECVIEGGLKNKLIMFALNFNYYYKAIFFMLIAYISIAMMSVFVKLLSDKIPSSEILFFRFFIGLVFITPLAIRDKKINLKTSLNKYLTLRNVAGLLSMLLMFYSLNYLPVSTAVLLTNTSSLFIPLFIFFIFKEKTSLPILVCTVIGFIGVYIMLSSSQQKVPVLYLLMGLVSAALAALAYIGIRISSKIDSQTQIVFYFHLTSSVMIPVIFSYNWVFPPIHEFYLLGMVGFFGLLFQMLVTKALSFSNTTAITPFMFVGVIASSIFDWIFWNNIPSAAFWTGTVIIVLSVSLLARLTSKKKHSDKD